MEKLLNYEPIKNLIQELDDFLPKLLGALVFFIAAWLLLKLVLFVVKKAIRLTRIDKFVEDFFKGNSIFNTNTTIKPSKVIVGFVKWFLILVFVIIGSDILGLTMVSNEVSRIMTYLPQVFSAFVIFGFGVYLATVLKKSTKTMLKSFDLSGTNVVSRIVFYLVFIVVTIVALNQAGINTDIVTDNLSIILGAFLAAFALGLGLGSREVILRLLLGFYARKNFEIGQQVRIDRFEGKIVAIDNICLVVESKLGRRVYPISEVSNKVVEII